MIEHRVIFILKAVGILLVGYSLTIIIFQGVLLSASYIEYGAILFGVAASMGAIRGRRTSKRDLDE